MSMAEFNCKKTQQEKYIKKQNQDVVNTLTPPPKDVDYVDYVLA